MLYGIAILILAGAAFELCNAQRRHIFKKRAKAVLEVCLQAECHADRTIPSGLPEPVIHYLNKALPEQLPPIQTVRLRYEGIFRTSLNGKWQEIKGEQYLSGLRTGFVWKGHTRLFSAIDSYIKNKGNLSVWLFSAIRIANKRGPAIDDAEMIRLLAESAMLPTNLLPSDDLQWQPVDAKSAKLVYSQQQKIYNLLVHFNSHNEIESVETERPFNGKGMQKWKGRFRNYKKIDEYNVPTELEASWIIDDEEKPYAMFMIKEMEFNCTEMFSH